ncbi:hypothetical protein BD414DRAFT_494621 [Trametes punicea]|nr:hypothetical protein BD414DRAFT_494621 [Trametes punicea]
MAFMTGVSKMAIEEVVNFGYEYCSSLRLWPRLVWLRSSRPRGQVDVERCRGALLLSLLYVHEPSRLERSGRLCTLTSARGRRQAAPTFGRTRGGCGHQSVQSKARVNRQVIPRSVEPPLRGSRKQNPQCTEPVSVGAGRRRA